MEAPLAKQAIVGEALRLGFDVCRIADPTSPKYAGYLKDWLANGRHGNMEWMEKNVEARQFPQMLMPECRSAIFLGKNYFQPHPDRRGRMAKYALGGDYHDWMKHKLASMEDFIVKETGARCRKFSDTSAVLEKPLGEQAGVGWQAKNTMLIHEKFGNWLLLGGLLTSLDLEHDEPGTDRCGSCSRCITACPTQAITAPYQLDARRCIAYLTIEHQGPIPEEFREAIGDRVFGCDECLDVCPWNRWAVQSREAHFAARSLPDLRDMLAWTDAEFRTAFRGTPVFRLKHARWLRNLCTVLGNIGTCEDLPAIRQAATSPDPMVREHAEWAVSRVQARCAGENQE